MSKKISTVSAGLLDESSKAMSDDGAETFGDLNPNLRKGIAFLTGSDIEELSEKPIASYLANLIAIVEQRGEQ